MTGVHAMVARLEMTLAWDELTNVRFAGFVVTRSLGAPWLFRATPIVRREERELMVGLAAANALKVAAGGKPARVYTTLDAHVASELILAALSYTHSETDRGVQS